MVRLFTRSLLLAALLGGSTLLSAQTAEPAYVEQFNALNSGQLNPLERANGVSQTSTHNWIVTVKSKSVVSFPGASSSVRVGPGTHFVVRLGAVDRDPATLIKLLKLEPAKNARVIPETTASANVIPFSGPKSEVVRNEGLPIHVQRFGNNSFEIIPDQPLAPGEYGFTSGSPLVLQCFGVDAGLTISPIPNSGPAKPPVPTPPSPARHPANTALDIAPAFPGAPPLHATQPAAEGCWWESFGSPALGIELPVQHCGPGASTPEAAATVSETPNGIGVRDSPTGRVGEVLIVHNKTATQTLSEAIKHDLFHTASERTLCNIVSGDKEGPFTTYGVTPVRGRKARCPFYQSDSDASTATTFFYDPAQSTTSYLEYTGEGFTTEPFDLRGLRFAKPAQ